MFLGAVLVMEALVRRVTIFRVLIVSLLVWIPLTVAVDSFFWGRLLW